MATNLDDRPVLRRKRFTRRQRKSATICPETGLILAAGSRASSSDEDDLPKKVRPSFREHFQEQNSRTAKSLAE